MVITHSKSLDQAGKVANSARGQLTRENVFFPVPVRASEFGLTRRVRQSRPASVCSFSIPRLNLVLPGRPRSFGHQRRPVDDCSPGRGGMAQNDGTRGGTFRGEVDSCSKSQGWTTACSGMPERDGKDQGDDSPKQAGSCWFARHSRLATSGANLYPPGGCRVIFLWRFTFVLFCFVFVYFLLSLKPRSFVQSLFFVLRYACAPEATRVT